MLGFLTPGQKLKFESLCILVLSYLRYWVIGKADTIVMPATIVVTNFTSNLGDMVCTTPLFRALKKAHPNARLIVVGTKKNGLLLRGNPDIDRYIPVESFWTTVKLLRKEKPDWGIALNPSPHEAGLMYLAGAKAITSFTYPGVFGKAFEAMAKLVITIPYVPGNYVPQEYLKLLLPFGINSHDTKKYMFVSEEARTRVKDKMRAHGVDLTRPLVIIAPTTGQTYKEWPPERFGAVIKYCAEKYNAGIALVGGPLDGTVGQKVIEASGIKTLYNGIGDSIEDLLATLSFATLIVAGDSGTIYIAEAFGASTLVIIGVTDAVEHPLNDKLHRVVVPEKQDFVLRSVVSNYDAVDTAAAMRHLLSIPVDAVTKEIDSLWHALHTQQG